MDEDCKRGNQISIILKKLLYVSGTTLLAILVTSCGASSPETTTKLNVLLKIHAYDPAAVKKNCIKGTGNFTDLGGGPEVFQVDDGTPVTISDKDGNVLQSFHINGSWFGKQGTDRWIPTYSSEGPGDSDTCIFDVEFGDNGARDNNERDLRIAFSEPFSSNKFILKIGKREPISLTSDQFILQPRLEGYEDYPDWWYLDVFLSPSDNNGGFDIPPTILRSIG